MYPIERRLYTLKRFVRNMARPEGSIAEAYVASECLAACSRYFDDVDTRHNREGRNRERVESKRGGLSVFDHGVDLLGAPRITCLDRDYDKMVWYVLNNCPEVDPYINIYKEELEKNGAQDVEKIYEKQFSSWFKKHLAKLHFLEGEDINDDLYALSCEPDLRVRVFSACLVGGVRYHTADREKGRRTQNSGVMTGGSHNGEDIDYYGCLNEIIELRYNSDSTSSRTVVLFRCSWFDMHNKKVRMKDDGFFKSINHGSMWYKDDPFILATQATKVFDLEDTKYGGSWRVVQKFAHRHLWSVAETEDDNNEVPPALALSYQDVDVEGNQIQLNEGNLEMDQLVDGDAVCVDASMADNLRAQYAANMQADASDEEDDTTWQYVSDNEGTTNHLQDDDDSDIE